MGLLLLLLLASDVNVDKDGDSIVDAEEQQLLEQFLPRFHIAAGDCDLKPAEFVRGTEQPIVKDRNGTIYGQAFPVEGGIELHYFHLWGMDCGRAKHPLDTEHVSTLVVRTEGKWKAIYWYAAAHEDTVCDRGTGARASAVNAESKGAKVWISRGKHASFLSEASCNSGCGSDNCARSEVLAVKQVLNLGEKDRVLHESYWVNAATWPLAQKMVSDFPLHLRKQLDEANGIAAANPQNPAVQPVILAGSTTLNSLELANAKTEGALTKARKSVKKFLGKYLN